jgi:hypothetical protein
MNSNTIQKYEREVLLSQLIPSDFRGRPKLRAFLELVDDGMSLDAVAEAMGWKMTTMKAYWKEVQDCVKQRFNNRLGVYWRGGRPVLVRYKTSVCGQILSVQKCE